MLLRAGLSGQDACRSYRLGKSRGRGIRRLILDRVTLAGYMIYDARINSHRCNMAKKKETEAPAEEAAAPAEKMTQREAVEKALAAGNQLPADGVPYVLKEFGITLSNQAFSTIKSKINTGGSGAAPKKRGRPAASANGAAPKPAAKTPTAAAANPAELARAVKALVQQHGPEAIKQMVDVFAE